MPVIQQIPIDPVCAQPVLGLGPPRQTCPQGWDDPYDRPGPQAQSLRTMRQHPEGCRLRKGVLPAAWASKTAADLQAPLGTLCFSPQFSPAPGLFFPTHPTITPAWPLQLLALWLLPCQSLSGTTFALTAFRCFALLHQGSPRTWTNLGG